MPPEHKSFMKKKPALGALCLLAVALPCAADTFLLKDATTVNGAVVSEAGDFYLVEVQVTKSIKDERKIAKSDVVKITREKPGEVAFAPIAKMLPTPDLLTAAEYEAKIAVVEKFVKEHRDSNKLSDAKAIVATLKSEHDAVAAGGIKFNDKILTAAEYQANVYDLDARVQEARIRGLVNDNEFLQALRVFAEFDRDYRNTLSNGALASLMRQVIQAQLAEAKQSLLTLDARTKERAAGIQRMPLADRKITEAAIKEEYALIEARYKAEKDAKQNWVTTSPFHKASLEDTVKFCEQELVRLGKVQTVLGVDGGKAYRDACTAVRGGSAAAAAAALAAAKTAAVPARYLAPLEAAAKGLK
jgi:hypothetical protein